MIRTFIDEAILLRSRSVYYIKLRAYAIAMETLKNGCFGNKLIKTQSRDSEFFQTVRRM